ncbi:MAG: ATP-binding cassette domain-containing protein [Spirochaetes bacterium]|jgi:simple sugar transport system ATP-binding protein|nr:ATP-binding cassette domain-containing protein [Spirochaetota bacterium]
MNAAELTGITKRFGTVNANDAVSLSIRTGEVHSLLGENGAGKTTLMKILFGLHHADAGSIRVNGEAVTIRRPSDAIALGIGMVHQHFMLVPRLTVTENVIAGTEVARRGFLDMASATAQVRELAERYRLTVNPTARVENISVGEQQRVEILKALYRRARILILDEPTAVLTPQETDELFSIIERLKEDGQTIIFITHKLRETMAVSDRVTVLRDGRVVDTVNTSETTPADLARMMVGREVLLRVERMPVEAGDTILEVTELSVESALGAHVRGVSLQVRAGEILGIAGVEGNGQLELEEAISGLRRHYNGTIAIGDRELRGGPEQRRRLGLAHIPSDRQRRGIIGGFSVAWNLILGSQWRQPFARRGVFRIASIVAFAKQLVRDFAIRAAGLFAPASSLSGGNQQKLIIAREFSRQPEVVLACQPTRGVDVGAIEYIHKQLLELRERGKGVLLISAELDEVRALSDRILVLYEGRIVAERPADCDDHELGLLMAGHTEESA